MTGALTIARYELSRRWALWFAAFVAGLLPMAFVVNGYGNASDLPPHLFDAYRFIPMGYFGESPTISETIFVLCTVLSWAVAFISGMSLVGRPLHDGRMSFYFTRPVSDTQIGIGKVFGGLGWIVGMQVAFALPVLCCVELTDTHEVAMLFALVFTGVAFLGCGLVVGILARSRTKWFVVDFVGGALAATLAIVMLASLNKRREAVVQLDNYDLAYETFRNIVVMLRVLLLAAVLCILGAVVVAVARGRTDRERVHRMLSLTLWPALIATALVGVGIARWGFQ